jgi:hypothetical protein
MGEFCERLEIHTRLLSGNLKGRDNLEDVGTDGRTILKLISKKQGVTVWNGFIWLRIRTRSGLL